MSNRSRTLIAVFAPSLLVAAIAGFPSTSGAQTERKTVSGSSIAVYDLVGRVTIEAGTGADVIVEITRGGRDAAKLGVEVGEVRGRNTLRVTYPSDDIVYPAMGRWSNSTFSMDRDGTWGSGGDRRWWNGRRVRVKGSGSGLEAWADLKILVPSGKRVEVDLGAGELNATNVEAELKLDVSSAHVTTSGTKGALSIDAGSGGVTVRNASGGDLNVDTGSGGVEFENVSGRECKFDTGSGGISGRGVTCENLDIDVGSGSVKVSDARAERVKLDTGSGGITFGMLNSPRALNVDAGSGGVTLTLPANLSAEVNIETGSGGIESDFPLTVDRYERHHVRGRIGDGAGRIVVESGSGSVRLRKA